MKKDGRGRRKVERPILRGDESRVAWREPELDGGAGRCRGWLQTPKRRRRRRGRGERQSTRAPRRGSGNRIRRQLGASARAVYRRRRLVKLLRRRRRRRSGMR